MSILGNSAETQRRQRLGETLLRGTARPKDMTTPMKRSPFYARIKAQVLQLTAAIPPQRLCTYQSIGEHLDVVPRHVAYILSQLDEGDKLNYPWHRVIGQNGQLGTPKLHPDGRSQADLLQSEGHLVTNNMVQTPLNSVFISAAELPSGLPKQQRPSDAPQPGTKSTRSRRRR